jgi:hypothetical protein
MLTKAGKNYLFGSLRTLVKTRQPTVPSIDAAKKLAGILDTTVGYLLGETDDYDLFKDPEMLKRFKELRSIGTKEREHILFALDSMLKNIKLKSL